MNLSNLSKAQLLYSYNAEETATTSMKKDGFRLGYCNVKPERFLLTKNPQKLNL